MTNQADQRQEANNAAARAGLAWLLAAGLAAEIDALRFPDGFSPVPAPGLTNLVADAERASANAALAADRVAALAADPEASGAASTAVADALSAACVAEFAARRVAQLAFGVSAHLIGDDRVERLDRAAVAVLLPPAVDQSRTRLDDDGMMLRAKVRPELVVEIAGALCRILVERDACLRMRGPAGALVEMSVDEGTTLRVLTSVEPPDYDSGWEAAMGGGWVARWPSPVTIREPAEAICDLLIPARSLNEGAVTIDVSSYAAELGRQAVSASPGDHLSPIPAGTVRRSLRKDAHPSELRAEVPLLLSQVFEVRGDWSLSMQTPPCCARSLELAHSNGILHAFAASFGLGYDWSDLECIELLRIGWICDPEHPSLFERTFVDPQLAPTVALVLETLEVMVGARRDEPVRVELSAALGPHSVPWLFSPQTPEHHTSQN